MIVKNFCGVIVFDKDLVIFMFILKIFCVYVIICWFNFVGLIVNNCVIIILFW